MPVVVSLLIAVVVSAVVFWLAARHGRTTDVVDVGAGAGAAAAEAAHEHPAFRRFIMQRRDPTKATGLLLTISVAVVAFAILLIGVVLQMVDEHSGFARFDDSAARYGAHHATPETTRVLKGLTWLGSTPFVIGVVIVVGGIEFWRHRRKALPLFLAVAVVSTVVTDNIIKVIVHRSRPDISRLVGAAGSSFPSGHSAAAAATYAAVALLLGRNHRRRVKAVLAGAAGAIAVAVAASRVLLGVHWLTDVIAGMLLGWSCFALTAMAFGGRVMQFGRPVEAAQQAAAADAAPSTPERAGSNQS